jgi:hypothetical protein
VTFALTFATLGTGLVLMTTPFTAENVPGTLNMVRHGYGPARFGLPLLGVLGAVLAVALSWSVEFVSSAWRRGSGRPLGGMVGWLSAPVARPRAAPSIAPIRLVGLTALAWLILVGLVVQPSARQSREEKRYEIFATALGPELPRAESLRWFDAAVRDQSVWVLGRASYPFAGPDLSNRITVMDTTRIRMLEGGGGSTADLPDVLVVSQVGGHPHKRFHGTFPPIESVLRGRQDLFLLLHEDAVTRIYGKRD